MENASKALIIAASVLIAIMIVAMGVTIFNKAQSSADTTSLDTTEINMFNQKFERYAGNQLGSQVKSLLSFAISNASTNQDDPSKLPSIGLTRDTTSKDDKATQTIEAANTISNFNDIRNAIVSTHTYWIEIEYGDNGLISTITIYWTKPTN